jgi:hypothetical protein
MAVRSDQSKPGSRWTMLLLEKIKFNRNNKFDLQLSDVH